jgi:hypothetical protein
MQVESLRSRFDPEKTFNARKTIYKALENSQKLEHEILRGISAKSIEAKQSILQIVSGWLMSVDSENQRKKALEMGKVSGMDLSLWINLQAEAAVLEADLTAKQKLKSEAEASYSNMAPLGFISGWLADAEEERKIKEKKAHFLVCKAQMEVAAQKLAKNISSRQSFGEEFIKKSLQNIAALISCEDVGPKIQDQLNDLALHMKNNWVLLKMRQTKFIESIKIQVAELDRNYE